MAGPSRQAKLRLSLTERLELRSVSESIEPLLGFTQDDFLNSRVQLKDRIHPDDSALADSLFAPHLDKRSGTFNIRIRHADGRIRCLKGQYIKKQDKEDGEVLLDLLLEDARQVREPGDAFLLASFKTLIEHTSDYIYIKNRNHVILAASRTLPYLSEAVDDCKELEGKTDYDIHPEETADTGYRLEKQAIAEGVRVDQIQQVAAQDGTKRWIDNRKYPINDPDGEVIGIFGIAPDITDYLETRNRLRESEESLRDAQEIAGLSNYVLDIPKKEWRTSPELETLLGIDAAYGRSFEGIWPLIHADDRPALAERFKRYFAGERGEFDSEYRVVRKTDGAVRWVHTRGRLELDAEGNPLTLRGTIQDITDRKQAEAALRESKEQLQLFVEHAPVELAMFDREMRYLAVSRRWAEDHGIDESAIIGRSHYEVNPDVPERWRETHRRGLAGEMQRENEDVYERSDGVVRWIRWQIIPWRAADGTVGGIVMFYEDITDRKKAEAALRESREFLKLFIEHAPAALAMFDREMHYLAVNRRWLEMSTILTSPR